MRARCRTSFASPLVSTRGRGAGAQPTAQTAGDTAPAAHEGEVQRGKPGDPQRGELAGIDDDGLEHVSRALEERIDCLLGFVFRFTARRRPPPLPWWACGRGVAGLG